MVEPNPATTLFITIQSGRVAVKYSGAHGGKVTRFISSLDDLAQFLAKKPLGNVPTSELRVVCSSAIDFPEEETDDEEAIAICRELRKE